MHRTTFLDSPLTGPAAMVGGAAFAAEGVVQLVHNQRDTGSRVVGLAGHLNIGFFIIALIAIAPALAALGELAGSRWSRRIGLAAGISTAALGLTSISSFVHGSDMAIFIVVAPLTNLVWLGGSIVLAVMLARRHRAPRAVAIGLPLSWVCVLVLSTFGFGLVGGAYWLAVGCLLAGGALAAWPALESQPAV